MTTQSEPTDTPSALGADLGVMGLGDVGELPLENFYALGKSIARSEIGLGVLLERLDALEQRFNGLVVSHRDSCFGCAETADRLGNEPSAATEVAPEGSDAAGSMSPDSAASFGESS